MKNTVPILLCTLIVFFGSCKADSSSNTQKPNVIILLTDDQGYGDLSCHGNPILKTPAMDKLHDESICFTDFHVSSICTPSRSQLLTGQDACRNGAFAWAYSREIIHPDVQIMPEVFRKNGYSTGHFGKWHLGDNYPYRPIDRGFDESIKHGGASIYQTPDYWNNDYMDDYYEHNGEMKQYNGYCTDIWFDEAKKFMTESSDEGKPFFIYLPTNTPHGPNIIPEKYSKNYLAKLENGFTPVPEFAGKKNTNQKISWFYGMIANLDENLEKLDKFLKEKKLFNNTIFIFMTDNGGTGGVSVYNAGMRGKKTSLYEGGHRVPFFLRWPDGNMSSHKDVNALTHVQDLFPTLAELCKLTIPEPQFDGKSLVPLIMDNTVNTNDRILVMQNARTPLPVKFDATVMWKKWRLVGKNELYRVDKDPGQQNNIAQKHPQVVAKLTNHYELWWESVQNSLKRIPHFPVGGDKCNNLKLTCFDWHGVVGNGNVTVQPTVRKGEFATGYWNIEILDDGEYEIRCSRWPAEANTPVRAGLPKHETLTITYPEGIALPICYAKIEISDYRKIIKVTDSDLFTSLRLNLQKGKYQLRAEFLNKEQNLVCGAYYAYVSKIK